MLQNPTREMMLQHLMPHTAGTIWPLPAPFSVDAYGASGRVPIHVGSFACVHVCARTESLEKEEALP